MGHERDKRPRAPNPGGHMAMTREPTVQDVSAAVLAAALTEIQNRHVAARLRAAALAAEPT